MLDTLWNWTPMGKLATNSFHHSDFIPGTVKKCRKLATRFGTSLCMTHAPARTPSSQSPSKSVVSLHPDLPLVCWTPIIWKLNPLWFSSTALPDQLFLFFPYCGYHLFIFKYILTWTTACSSFTLLYPILKTNKVLKSILRRLPRSHGTHCRSSDQRRIQGGAVFKVLISFFIDLSCPTNYFLM